MPRYIVERVFPGGHVGHGGFPALEACGGIVAVNEAVGVTWLHTYVGDDGGRTWCLYEARDPESIRRAAERNELPVERLTRVSVLDPHVYAPAAVQISQLQLRSQR